MVVRQASPADLDAAIEILEEASEWVARRGADGWEPGSFRSPQGSGNRALREALAAGELYLAWLGNRPVATVTLQSADPIYWPEAVDRGDALYVHRLAVQRDASGSGVGRTLLRWAEEQARGRGRPFVRLDCPARSRFLRDYYHQAGFRHRGDLTVSDFHARLLEKPVRVPAYPAGRSRGR